MSELNRIASDNLALIVAVIGLALVILAVMVILQGRGAGRRVGLILPGMTGESPSPWGLGPDRVGWPTSGNGLSGKKSAATPWLIGVHVSPPSSLRKAPAAEIAA